MDTRSQGDALLAAASWLQTVLTGPLTVILAILGVAGLGLAMLYGKASLRQATHILLGCFILFSSAIIAKGLMALSPPHPAEEIAAYSTSAISQSNKPPVKPAFVPATGANPFDPYAQSPVQGSIGAGP